MCDVDAGVIGATVVLSVCATGFVFVLVILFVNESCNMFTSDGRAVFRYNRVVARKTARYINAGIEPSVARGMVSTDMHYLSRTAMEALAAKAKQ